MNEEEIVEVLKKENEEFNRLYHKHRDLDSQLLELQKKTHLTAEDEIEILRIKKEKLYKKDRIAELIREYKKHHSQN